MGRDVRDDRALYLEHGKPLIFGKAKEKGIRMNGLRPEIVELKDIKDPMKELLIHDENVADPTYAYLLTQMNYPEMPVPFGVLRCIEKPTYDEMMNEQVKALVDKKGKGKLEDLLFTEDVWTVGNK